MDFNQHLATIGLALLTLAVVGFGIGLIGSVSAAEVENETATFGDEDATANVSIEWADSISATDATATVTFYNDGAYAVDGDDVLDSHMATTSLNGTTAEFDPDNMTEGTTYDVELDSSATTVTVNASDINDDGTVDLSEHTSTSLTADDTVLSVTATAKTVHTETVDSDAGNTTNLSYTTADGDLETGTAYRIVVDDDGNADAISSVSIDAPDAGGMTLTAKQEGMAIGAVLMVLAIGLVMYAKGGDSNNSNRRRGGY